MTDKRQETTRILRSRDDVQAAIRTLSMWQASPEQPVQVIIKPYKRNRSRDQNRLYWKWLTEIENETGQDREELHTHYKTRFLAPILVRDIPEYAEMSVRVKQVRADGHHDIADYMKAQIMFLTSTSGLNTKQFSEYMDLIERDAVNLGITLTQPTDAR